MPVMIKRTLDCGRRLPRYAKVLQAVGILAAVSEPTSEAARIVGILNRYLSTPVVLYANISNYSERIQFGGLLTVRHHVGSKRPVIVNVNVILVWN